MELETEVKEHRFLEQEGDVNHLLEETLPNQPDFYTTSYAIPGDDGCRLEHIRFDSAEKVYTREPNYFIACTSGGPGNAERGWKDGRKGHDVRNMAVWNNHGVLPSIGYMEYTGNMLKHLRDLTAEQVDDGEFVVGGSMQTFNDHAHFIAEDLENDGESDLPGLNNYALYSVENGIPELETLQAREKIGDYMEQALTL